MMLIIDNSNYKQYINPSPENGGGEKRFCSSRPSIFSTSNAPYKTSSLAPPRSEWKSIIDRRKERGLGLINRLKRDKFKLLNQHSTNFCWAYAPTQAQMINAHLAGQEYKRLSADFVACQITNFQNIGGNAGDTVNFLQQHGTCETKYWPEGEISKRYLTPEAKINALSYKMPEWNRVSTNLDLITGRLFAGDITLVGYLWWQHEGTLVDIDYDKEGFLWGFANTWGEQWGNEGYAWLRESKARPDDAIIPLVSLAS